jgi:hypothetical protein
VGLGFSRCTGGGGGGVARRFFCPAFRGLCSAGSRSRLLFGVCMFVHGIKYQRPKFLSFLAPGWTCRILGDSLLIHFGFRLGSRRLQGVRGHQSALRHILRSRFDLFIHAANRSDSPGACSHPLVFMVVRVVGAGSLCCVNHTSCVAWNLLCLWEWVLQ